jgi:hypothetical protein
MHVNIFTATRSGSVVVKKKKGPVQSDANNTNSSSEKM